MIAAQNANNLEKIISYGDKVLAIDPNDLNAMITLSSVIPRRLPTDDAGKKAALDKADDLATKALAGIQALRRPKALSRDADRPQLENKSKATSTPRWDWSPTTGRISEIHPGIRSWHCKSTPKDEVAHFYLGVGIPEPDRTHRRPSYTDAVKAENDAKATKAEQPFNRRTGGETQRSHRT